MVKAIHPSTGDILYDTFADDASRGETETRLIQIQPKEIIVSESISQRTKKLLKTLSLDNTISTAVRIEFLKPDSFMYESCLEELQAFYAKDPSHLDTILQLPEDVIVCIAVLINYLKDFQLDNIFNLTQNIRTLTTGRCMRLNGTTLENLEVLFNSTTKTEKGSLYWGI